MRTRFGMLMTDAVGKAGGQCIQRRGNTRVLRNITIPTQRQASTQNKQRFTANVLFSIWSTLTQAVRDEWATIGTLLRGLDTFGNEKGYTGREAFLKCNGVYYNFSSALIDPSTFNYTVPTLECGTFLLRKSTTLLDIAPISNSLTACVQMKAVLLRNSAVNPTVEKLKTFIMTTDFAEADGNYSAFETLFPSVTVGQFYSIAVRSVSASGLVSPWIQQQVKVIL